MFVYINLAFKFLIIVFFYHECNNLVNYLDCLLIFYHASTSVFVFRIEWLLILNNENKWILETYYVNIK